MSTFRRRQAYAMLQRHIAAGELPQGRYKFVQRAERVWPRLEGASLTSEQVKVLDRVVRACSPFGL